MKMRSINGCLKNCVLPLLMNGLMILSMEAQSPEDIPAFPHAEGFGAYSMGGRGGKVIFVDNLNDDGAGSFRAAVMDPEPRIVIFRVSGTIDLKSRLYITSPYLTIAGQTAPGDGICLKRYPLQIRETHDVIIRGIRVRPGNLSGDNVDAIELRRCQKVIIDHCSASWSLDEILNTTHNNEYITVQWCIFSEALNIADHGFGATIGGERNSYHHNLFVHNAGRVPSIGGDEDEVTEWVDFRNNLVYNWDHRSCDGKPRTINFAGNFYRPGPATNSSVRRRLVRIDNAEKYGYSALWYIEGNTIDLYPVLSADNWFGAVDYEEGSSMEKNRAYFPFENFNYRTRDPRQAKDEILEHAGVTVPRRDAVDLRIIEETRNWEPTFGDGIIDSVEQTGGWPELLTYDVPADTDNDGMPDEWEIQEGLTINDPSDRYGIKEGEVYDNLERYLNELASDKPYLLPPVNLEASLQNEGEVALKWKDISVGELGFVIQRTNTDNSFISIDTVEANVTEFIDYPTGPDRTLVYRVFAFDTELTSVPSRPASIQLKTSIRNRVSTEKPYGYPNPFEGQFNFVFETTHDQFLNIRVYNISGSVMLDMKDVRIQAGKNEIPVMLGDIPQGVYVLEYSGKNAYQGYLMLIRM